MSKSHTSRGDSSRHPMGPPHPHIRQTRGKVSSHQICLFEQSPIPAQQTAVEHLDPRPNLLPSFVKNSEKTTTAPHRCERSVSFHEPFFQGARFAFTIFTPNRRTAITQLSTTSGGDHPATQPRRDFPLSRFAMVISQFSRPIRQPEKQWAKRYA